MKGSIIGCLTKKTNTFTTTVSRHALFSLTIEPAILNALSDGVEVAGWVTGNCK